MEGINEGYGDMNRGESANAKEEDKEEDGGEIDKVIPKDLDEDKALKRKTLKQDNEMLEVEGDDDKEGPVNAKKQKIQESLPKRWWMSKLHIESC